MNTYYVNYTGSDNMITIDIHSSVETIKDLKAFLQTKGLYNENTDIIAFGSNTLVNSQLSSLSEESDRKCRELCEEMSALKASNESEVKALKAQLKTDIDSMQTMEKEINDLKQKLSTSNSSRYIDGNNIIASRIV
ncbi:unnamed protein product [Medioppia subpectinata]|uniref:Uncharacterized protein n=1 Tax=Medioppia subpectinata TaxID=1979941 RepID=A0A7R9Q1B8_9ACAR|nr:unnamed protein product [Medioppia subpectinata]CAG2108925.1 unnamed protein product [Medioppia subpectinata]